MVEGFDDATVVWTHREPEQAVGSLASFIRATQDMHERSGTIMLDRIGKDVLSFASEMIKRADKFFDNRTKKQTPRCMVMYTELIKDPIGTVKKLYKEVGYEFTAEYEELLEVYVDMDMYNVPAPRSRFISMPRKRSAFPTVTLDLSNRRS